MVWAEITNWLIVLIGFGLIGLPICFCILRNLPGRGIAFSRIAALILFGFIYWISGSLGLTGNTLGSALVVLIPLVALSLKLWLRYFNELRAWFKINNRYWILNEIVFLLAFGLVLLFRLSDPNISGTEKPMEMTFINGILNSDSFPPHDSWLSGYGISYYYFGYLLTAVLIRFAGVQAEVGFNLMLATVFGLAASAAFALVTDLLNLARKNRPDVPVKIYPSSWLAPLFLLIASNLEGLFELMYARGLFWKADGTSRFWQWLGLKELNSAPTGSPSWDITQRPGIWWWRASRVVSDTGLDGSSKEIIDEFPFFAFYLGDLHPHVLAIPLVLLAIALALNLYLRTSSEYNRTFDTGKRNWIDTSVNISHLVRNTNFWFSAICIGGLIFMNTWDFPIYFAIYCGAYALAIFEQSGKIKYSLIAFIEKAVPFGIACILFYFLFLTGLSSQAGGIIPSGVFTTRPIQLFIMFGLFLVPVLWWLWLKMRDLRANHLKPFLKFSMRIALGLFVIETVFFAALAWFNQIGPELQTSSQQWLSNLGALMKTAGSAYAGVQGFSSFQQAISGFLSNRLFSVPLLVILFGSAAILLGILFTKKDAELNPKIDNNAAELTSIGKADKFVAILLLMAFFLILFPEFFYLRDFFGTRMNTIFKFYYQVWILMSLSSAYLCARIGERLSKGWKLTFQISMTIVVVASLIYPLQGIADRTESVVRKLSNENRAAALHLDGAQFLKESRPDDWAGVEWLKANDPGVIVEKVGSSYTSDNMVSTFSGNPTILGPTNHESQWRGGYTEIGTREADVLTIYESRDWDKVETLLAQYQVRYVFIGSAERAAYRIQEQKFERNLALVFESGNCKIYQVY